MAPKKTKDGTADVLELIAAMPDGDRAVAEKLHATITKAAPELVPRLWYGQPAYAKDGTNVVFFRGAAIDGERYLSLGFTSDAALDDGKVWPTSYAVTALGPADAKRVADLVKKAVG